MSESAKETAAQAPAPATPGIAALLLGETVLAQAAENPRPARKFHAPQHRQRGIQWTTEQNRLNLGQYPSRPARLDLSGEVSIPHGASWTGFPEKPQRLALTVEQALRPSGREGLLSPSVHEPVTVQIAESAGRAMGKDAPKFKPVEWAGETSGPTQRRVAGLLGQLQPRS